MVRQDAFSITFVITFNDFAQETNVGQPIFSHLCHF